MAKILHKLAYGNVKTMQPKRKQVDNFARYCEQYFKKPGTRPDDRNHERITAAWPGRSFHALEAQKDVKRGDFEMELMDENEFAWFGNGGTVTDFDNSASTDALSWYLNAPRFVHDLVSNIPNTTAIEKEMVRNKSAGKEFEMQHKKTRIEAQDNVVGEGAFYMDGQSATDSTSEAATTSSQAPVVAVMC
ncbi:hypothetical protein LTR64_007791 [Lithohypha guttulata]|uniref:uncharacterized protein n=1 Tax=Lithohypha guttulata TaxID=1690604 RepID=UPI002DDFA657|nr:hypothetical protein LTR51_007303 [Lithohypha guttulata]